VDRVPGTAAFRVSLPRPRNRRRWQGLGAATALVVDPEGSAEADIRGEFGRHGVDLTTCDDAAEALFQAGSVRPGLVVLRAVDSVLPVAAAIRVVRNHSDVPLVIAVGEGETGLVRSAFDEGASALIDYPYRCLDIVDAIARFFPDAELRRAERAVVTVGQVELDGPAFEVRLDGQRLAMPLREFELLRFLMTNVGHVVTEEQIRIAVWEARGDTVRPKTIALHARRLRLRLDGTLDLVRVRGVGYRLEPCPA